MSENNELYFFLLYLHDAHGLLRALHSHNPTQYENKSVACAPLLFSYWGGSLSHISIYVQAQHAY